MSDANERIERFKYMAEADPQNELGHFSLGRAYMDAGRFADAVPALQKALSINKNLSKAYQMMGQSHLELGETASAIGVLTEGIKIADSRGDVLPRNEMADMLRTLGASVPEIKSGGPSVQAGEGEVLCRRCGRVGKKLDKPPFRNEFGQKIFESTCAPCWQEAIRMGTKVINELRLEMFDPRAQKIWDTNIREFLNLA